MTRRENWPSLLNAFVESCRESPFHWGTHDCCAFAAKAVEAITGEDVFAPWSAYTDAMSAARLVQSAGGVDAIADRVLGERIGNAFAQRGDVLLLSVDGRDSLAVCFGGVCAAPGIERLEFLPTGSARCAWRV